MTTTEEIEEIKNLEAKRIEMMTGDAKRREAARIAEENRVAQNLPYPEPHANDPEPSEEMRKWLKMTAWEKAHNPKPDR